MASADWACDSVPRRVRTKMSVCKVHVFRLCISPNCWLGSGIIAWQTWGGNVSIEGEEKASRRLIEEQGSTLDPCGSRRRVIFGSTNQENWKKKTGTREREREISVKIEGGKDWKRLSILRTPFFAGGETISSGQRKLKLVTNFAAFFSHPPFFIFFFIFSFLVFHVECGHSKHETRRDFFSPFLPSFSTFWVAFDVWTGREFTVVAAEKPVSERM